MSQAENLMATLDQFNTAVFLKNPEGRYLSMNRAGIQMMRKNNESVLGRSAFDLFDVDSATEMVESDEYVLHSNSIYTRSYDAKDLLTGAPLHIFTAKSPILAPSGKALGIVGVSIVNAKNSALFSATCKLLPRFVRHKYSKLVEELIETRTIVDFFKIH